MASIRRHSDPSLKGFLRRTVSAQLHLLGTLAAIIGLALLLRNVGAKGDSRHFWACLVFGVTGILVFATSTTYHFMTDGFDLSPQLDQRLEDLDHFAIFLFIAGTYTPFILNVINPPWRQILLCLIWVVGLLGVVYTHFRPRLPAWAQHRYVYTGIFVLMGWTLMIRIGEALEHLSSAGVYLAVAGGLSYTVGAVIYAVKWPNPIKGLFGFHEVWHVMVLLGFGFHYAMILNFYKPLF